MAEVVFEQVTCRYAGAGAPAVRALDLEIRDGELFVLCGPAESGKSTVLRMLAGLVPVTEGRLLVGGHSVGEDPAPRVSMVFQNYALYPNLTVGDNIALPLRRQGVRSRAAAPRAREAAARLQLADLLGHSVTELTAGQRIRVALARELVREPEVLLMDEPLANLQPTVRSEITELLASAQREHGVTSVLATADPDEALALGDRVALLDAGVLHEVVVPSELDAPPRGQRIATPRT